MADAVRKGAGPTAGGRRRGIYHRSKALTASKALLLKEITEQAHALVTSIGDDEADELIERRHAISKPLRQHRGKAIVRDAKTGKIITKLQTVRDVALVRMHRAVERVAERVPDVSLLEVAAAESDLTALIQTLHEGALELSEQGDNPLAGAMALAVQHKQELLDLAGEMLSSPEVEKLLGITRAGIDKRRDRRTIFAVRVGQNWQYPQLQFDPEGRVWPGIEAVLKIHAEDSEWVVLDALLSEDPAFNGRKMIDVIREGRLDLIDLYGRQEQGDGFI